MVCMKEQGYRLGTDAMNMVSKVAARPCTLDLRVKIKRGMARKSFRCGINKCDRLIYGLRKFVH